LAGPLTGRLASLGACQAWQGRSGSLATPRVTRERDPRPRVTPPNIAYQKILSSLLFVHVCYIRPRVTPPTATSLQPGHTPRPAEARARRLRRPCNRLKRRTLLWYALFCDRLKRLNGRQQQAGTVCATSGGWAAPSGPGRMDHDVDVYTHPARARAGCHQGLNTALSSPC
jgi:hypothetical protein